MCICDSECRQRHIDHQKKLLEQIGTLGQECHAWREVSDRFPPAHMIRYMNKTDACGWGNSLRDGVLGFDERINFWKRLVFLFTG